MKKMQFTLICVKFGLYHVIVSANQKSCQNLLLVALALGVVLCVERSSTTYPKPNNESVDFPGVLNGQNKQNFGVNTTESENIF